MRLPDWRGRKVVCIASGPSLTLADCELARASGRLVIVTNSTYKLCPWADALYGFDPTWWRANLADIRRDFRGLCFTQWLSPPRGILCARLNPRFRTFANAGTNAISLAVAQGSRDVVMLGYDCSLGPNGEAHHHADHPDRNCDTLPAWPARFARLAAYCKQRGALVVNASRTTALDCFDRVPLEEAL